MISQCWLTGHTAIFVKKSVVVRTHTHILFCISKEADVIRVRKNYQSVSPCWTCYGFGICISFTHSLPFSLTSLSSFYLLLTFAFVVLFIADLKYYILPDSMIVLSLFCIIAIFLVPCKSPPYLISAIGREVFLLSLAYYKGKGYGIWRCKTCMCHGVASGLPEESSSHSISRSWRGRCTV